MGRRLRVRGVLVARLDCRLVGMAASGRRRAAHRAGRRRRRRAGARGALRAAQFNSRRRSGAHGRGGCGRLDRRTARGGLGGRGPALRRRARRQRWAAQGLACLRHGRCSVALRGRLGSRHRRLFRRPADRGPTALAQRLTRQDLGRGDRRRVRRGRPRPRSRGVDEPPRGAVLAWPGDGDRVRAWRFVRNRRSSGVSASRIRAASFPAMAD